MANSPTFIPSEEQPALDWDELDDLIDADRELRRATARRVTAIVAADARRVRPGLFENRMLAERSFRAEVAVRLTITEREAENLIGYSRVLSDAFPKTLLALAEGRITWRHATVIVDELAGLAGLAGLDDVDRAEIEATALAEAPFVTSNRLGRIVRLQRETLHPDTIPLRQEKASRLRGVSVVDDRDGMSTMFWRGQSVHVHAAFNRLTTGAKGMTGPLEERTLDQLRSDILTHYLLADVDGAQFGVVPDEWDDENFVKWFRGITATVVVSVPVLTLLGQSQQPATLDGWVPIDPDTALVLAAGADSFIRILTDPETGTILSVGRKRYKVPGDLKRVLEIRDLTCRFPGCEIEAARTDKDHNHDWQFGGETKLINLGCVCRGHHSLKTAGLWTVTQDDNGVMTWVDPRGRSYVTRPHRPMAA